MINRFRGDYNFLSNFFWCPVKIDGITYLNAEAAYQAQKSSEQKVKENFARLPAHVAKSAGRKIDIREDFEEEKLEVMKKVVTAKFRQSGELTESLIDTYPQELQEGNEWGDKFWGVVNGEGQNHLGKILMEVRETLIKEKGI